MADRSKAAKLLDQKRRFAALYVNGPDRVRGNWNAVNVMLGSEVPQSDEDVRRFIEEEGGLAPIVAPVAEAFPALELAKPGAFVIGTPEQIDDAAQAQIEAALAINPQTQSDWCKMAAAVQPVMQGIAAGTVKTTAAQVASLRHIMDRCYGKVQESQSDMKPAAGVLLLPVLGSDKDAHVCPQCGYNATQDARPFYCMLKRILNLGDC